MQFGLADLWHHMGLMARGVVFLLGIMSILSLFISIERFVALRRFWRENRRLLADFERNAKRRAWQDAIKSAESFARSPLSRILPTGLRAYVDARASRSLSRADVIALTEEALARGTERELLELRRGIGVLATVGSTAPFIGLFGTVVGIINAFRQIALRGSGGLGTVSAGIAEALVTTAVGIGVAIVAVMFFNYFTNRIEIADAALRDASAALLQSIRREDADAPAAAA